MSTKSFYMENPLISKSSKYNLWLKAKSESRK